MGLPDYTAMTAEELHEAFEDSCARQNAIVTEMVRRKA